MPSGQVIMFKRDKGYGFIKPDDGANNVYVHVSALPSGDSLDEGQKLSYDLHEEDGKISAINIKLL